jgi:hypothetical protein
MTTFPTANGATTPELIEMAQQAGLTTVTEIAVPHPTSDAGGAVSAYRYTLTRNWGDGGRLLWVMLNPSTADETQDDPTIRRCVGFSKAGGYGCLMVVNLFAARATNPADLAAIADPVGIDNDAVILDAIRQSTAIVFAWGAHNTKGRAFKVATMCRREGREPLCLGKTKDGHPRHPLYVPAAQPFEEWA